MSHADEIVIAPSLLASDFGNLAQSARNAEAAGAEWLHFDVMDGHFVPPITMGTAVVQALRPVTRLFYDVHLMIEQPERHLEAFAAAGADGITVQVEECRHLQRTLKQIRDLGLKAGVALNPATSLDTLEYVLDDVDLVNIMTVNPGYGGQPFLRSMLPKIARMHQLAAETAHPIRIEIDGGVGVETAPLVTVQGATVLVAGTSVYAHPEGVAAGVAAIRAAIRRPED